MESMLDGSGRRDLFFPQLLDRRHNADIILTFFIKFFIFKNFSLFVRDGLFNELGQNL